MAKQQVMIDAGVIYALADKSDKWHAETVKFMKESEANIVLLTSCSVVPEAAYLIQKFLGSQAETAFLESLIRNEVTLSHASDTDLARAQNLLAIYNDLKIGIANAILIALCERLRITRILTIDRRHFRAIKPAHCAAFELLP